MWLAHVMERALFQMKTNLQDALSGGIHFVHYNVMQMSKNRNKIGYLRHCPTHTNLRLHDTSGDTHTLMMIHGLIACCCPLFPWVFTTNRRKCVCCTVRQSPDRIPPCTVLAEEAATWWTPTVISRRTTTGRERATKHIGWAWSLKRDHNTSRLLSLQILLYSTFHKFYVQQYIYCSPLYFLYYVQ